MYMDRLPSVLAFCTFASFLFCTRALDNTLKLDVVCPKRIEVTNIETNEKEVVTDIDQINSLISILSNSRREVVRFRPKVKIEIVTPKEVILLLYADGYVKYNGISYKVTQRLVF